MKSMWQIVLALAAPVSVAVAGVGLSAAAQAAPSKIYADRTSFLAGVGQSNTDTFSDYGAPVQLNNVAMHAVNGETMFEPLTFPGLNLVSDYLYRPGDYGYCAGCNGNFKLWFDSTSLSLDGGVFGVALDVVLHTSRRVSIGDDDPSNPTLPSEMLVEFADGATTSIDVPADVGYYGKQTYFIGITDARGIRSITVGTEPTPQRHTWLIDNLTIAAPVPEPATLAIVGLALAGIAATRMRKLAPPNC